MKMSYDLTLKRKVRGGRLAAKEMKGERSKFYTRAGKSLRKVGYVGSKEKRRS